MRDMTERRLEALRRLMLMTDWNPTLYSKFEAERMRAARDLLARVPLESGTSRL